MIVKNPRECVSCKKMIKLGKLRRVRCDKCGDVTCIHFSQEMKQGVRRCGRCLRAAYKHNPKSVSKDYEENLKRWFGNSKTTDRNGNPIVFYHQTARKFKTFKAGGYNKEISGEAMWFGSPSQRERLHAGHQVTKGHVGMRVIPVFLKVVRPLVCDTSEMLEFCTASYGTMFPEIITESALKRLAYDGYDGIFYWYAGNKTPIAKRCASNADEIIVFKPNQIKSAIGNRGTFDPDDPIITNPRRR